MDLIDKKIICELDKDCRQTNSQIAKNIKQNRNLITYRLNKLEEEKIIKNYICSVNLPKLGYQTYKIFFKTLNNEEQEKNFIKEIKKQKAIIHLLRLEGKYDFSTTIAVKNIQELDRIITNLKTNFSHFIKDYFVSIIVK